VSPMASAGLVIAGMLALIVARVPIGAAMFIAGAAGFWALVDYDPLMSHLRGAVWARFSNYDLSVIPLFVLMGHFAAEAGFSRALFRAAHAFVGHLRGGIAMSAIVACAAFGTICGSSVATAATMSQVALPEMRRFRYANPLATGTLVAGGTLGIIIPPSVVLILYAVIAEQNIAKLFAAAFVPGFIAAMAYLAVIAIVVRWRPDYATVSPKAPPAERRQAVRTAWPIAAIFVGMFGGLYGGIFTPTEAATMGAIGTLLLGVLRRELRWQGMLRALLPTAQTTALIFFILLGADMMNSALAVTQLPAQVGMALSDLAVHPLVIVGGILAIYVLLGAVLDEVAIAVLTLPIILPTILGLDLYGLDPDEKSIWFGILMLSVIQIGLILPPVALNIYVVNSFVRDVRIQEIYRGVMLFVTADIARLVLLLAVPSVSLWAMRLIE
jgi:C4-dicarboxylate transporter DctM subunit